MGSPGKLQARSRRVAVRPPSRRRRDTRCRRATRHDHQRHHSRMPRKGAQAKAFAAQQAKKREAEKQEARAKVDAEKNNAKGISECRDVGQLMRMHRANSERIEHMEEAQEKEAKRKEAERARGSRHEKPSSARGEHS